MSSFCLLVDFAAPVSSRELRAMAAASGRSGPDGESRWLGGAAGLGHQPVHTTRESQFERQPVHNPDGPVHLVADARLDNREELCAELEIPGDCGDAALILAAYLRWGEPCPEHLLGDFAFAVWDTRRRQVFCACDPSGVKPLHWARLGSRILVASEAQQILAHPGVSRRLDEIAVGDYLAGCTSDPDRTFFLDVRRLPPACHLVAGEDGLRTGRWWDLDPGRRTIYARDEDYEDHLRELLRRSVEARLRTQAGSVGVLMSGGLDSCSVAATACQVRSGGRSRLFAGSFVFDRLTQCDERVHIRTVAEHLALETELVQAERFPIFGGPADSRPPLETPFLAWESCFHEMFRRARSRGARVLLTGHGGDDLLSGTPLIYADRLRRGDLRAAVEVARHAAARGRAWRWVLYHYLARPLLPSAGDRALRWLSGRREEASLPAWIERGFAHRTGLDGRAAVPPPRRTRESAREVIRDHFRQAPWDQVAHWYDRNAARFGIEVRHPFLDRRLIEFLASIPPDRLFRVGHSKPLLRRSMAGLLPDPVRLRPDKTRLSAFLDLSLRETRRNPVAALLAAPLGVELGFLNGEGLRAAFRSYQQDQQGEPDESQRILWYAITFEAWLQEHAVFLGVAPPAAARPAA